MVILMADNRLGGGDMINCYDGNPHPFMEFEGDQWICINCGFSMPANGHKEVTCSSSNDTLFFIYEEAR